MIRGNQMYGNGEDGIQFIDYAGISNRHYHVVGNDIYDNDMAGIGCMDNEETDEDYRAARIPEPIVLENNRIRGNQRDLSLWRAQHLTCVTLLRGGDIQQDRHKTRLTRRGARRTLC